MSVELLPSTQEEAPKEKTALEKGLETIQIEYNRLVAQRGHLETQIELMQEDLKEIISGIQVQLKKAKTLQSNAPKKKGAE